MDQISFDRCLSQLLDIFADPAVDEVFINGGRGLWVARGSEISPGSTPFPSSDDLTAWVQELALGQGLRLDPLSGSAGGTLCGYGFRWHAVLPPLSPDGALLALRRHRFRDLTLADFAMPPEVAGRILAAVRRHANVLIVGPTGSGKTSLLAAVLQQVSGRERVVLCEALAELPLPSAASLRLLERSPNLEGLGGVSLERLVREALRLRPDRLVIGEVRGSEAVALCEAMMAGHLGVLATLHADGPQDALARLAWLSGRSQGELVGAWAGVPVTVVCMARGSPPAVREVAALAFVPSR